MIDDRCPHVDRDGHLRETFAEPAPPDEAYDPPLASMPSRVERADMETFGRSRLEVAHVLVHRMLGEKSQFNGAKGRPRPSIVREALKELCILWHDQDP
eukprot:3033575-Alexandrium_andersonii.AAC.1